MSKLADVLREANLKFTAETGKEGLEVFLVHGDENSAEFLALVFPAEQDTPFLRLVFFLDRIRSDDPFAQYERLLELNREAWMGAYAVDPSTSSVIYVFNFPLADFDASALVVTQETFRLAQTLYEDAMRESGSEGMVEPDAGKPSRTDTGE